MVHYIAAICAGAFLLASCTAADDEDPDQGGRLPAGVEVVTSPSDTRPLELTEDLRIGVAEGVEHLQFHRVRAIAIAPDGTLFVADGGSGEIRIFGSDGTYLDALGRLGDGPGEFQYVTGVFKGADDVVVFDARHLRTTRFSGPDYGVVDTWSALADGERRRLIGYGAGAYVMASRREWSGWRYEVGVPVRDTVRVLVSNTTPAGDAPADPVLMYVTGRTFGIHSEMAMTANSPLWEPEPAVAVDQRGRTFKSDGRRYMVDVFEPNGTHVRRVVRDHTPVPSSQDLVDRYHDIAANYWAADSLHYGEWLISQAAQVDRVQLPRSESLPALGRILVSSRGAFWVERPDLAEDPVLLEWTRDSSQAAWWDVFDAEGSYVGTAALEPSFTPFAVTANSVVGVWRSELGVEYVVRRSIRVG